MTFRRVANKSIVNALVTTSRLKVPVVDVLPVLSVGGQFMGVSTATGVDLWYYDGDHWYKVVESSGGGGMIGLAAVLATNNNSGGVDNIILDNNGGAGVGALTSDSGDDLNLLAGAVNTSAPGAGSETLRLASGTAGLINMDAGTLGIDIDSVGAFTLDVTAGGISLDAAGVSNFTTTAGDIGISAVTGSNNISAGEAVADAINIDAPTGGIDLDCDSGFTLDVASGGMSLDAAGVSNVTTTGDFTVNSTAGKLILAGGDAGLDAIDINAASGGIDIDCDSSFTVDVASGGISLDATGTSNFSTTTGDMTIGSTAGSVIVTSSEAASDAIQLLPTNAAANVHVGSGASDSTALLAPNGTVTNPSVAFISDPDTGLYLNASGDVALVAGGEEVVSFASGSPGLIVGATAATSAHMTSLQTSAPTLTPLLAANPPATAIGTVTDTSGTVSFAVDGSGSTGAIVVTFSQAFATPPHVVATPVDPGSGLILTDLIVDPTTTTFTALFTTVGAAASLNAFSWHIIA